MESALKTLRTKGLSDWKALLDDIEAQSENDGTAIWDDSLDGNRTLTTNGRNQLLKYVIRNGLEWLKALMEHVEVLPNEHISRGRTVFHYAARWSPEILQYYLEEYKSRNIEMLQDLSSKKRNALHFACLGGNASSLQLLAQVFPSWIFQTDYKGFLPIHIAVDRNHEICVKCLFACVNETFKHGGVEMKQKLLTGGVAPCVHFAIFRNTSSNVLNAILEECRTEDVNYKWSRSQERFRGFTPLMIAAYYGRRECAERLLLREDINVDIVTHQGLSAAMIAGMKGHGDILSQLIEKSADLSQVDQNGRNVLHWSCAFSRPDCVRRLLDSTDPSDVLLEAVDMNGATPLGLAWMQASQECVSEFTKSGIPVDSVIAAGMKSQDDTFLLLSAALSPFLSSANEIETDESDESDPGGMVDAVVRTLDFDNDSPREMEDVVEEDGDDDDNLDVYVPKYDGVGEKLSCWGWTRTWIIVLCGLLIIIWGLQHFYHGSPAFDLPE
eukprot:TRINITY_DN82197_c0_g1_i1.p1 TRINITY_DN82197_c0_g1~~TRINITY_DN82197_c0_g1_i1.p1  ORF type:complete len:498 (+),score=117.30 TRINITY_DN82197_c0_g1_i1:91-1584(+)